jgi:hypothetical protein
VGGIPAGPDAGNLGPTLLEVVEREFIHRPADAATLQFGIDGIQPDLAPLPLRVHDGEDEAGDGAIELHDVHPPVGVPPGNLAQRLRVLLFPVLTL